MSETIYEPAKDTARKIRKALKPAFPGIKFSVRSSTFSMGSSVDVSWTDGPTQNEVDSIIGQFQSYKFDGQTDTGHDYGYTDPTDGLKYRGAKYVSGQRDLSPEFRATRIEWLAERYPDGEDGLWFVYQWDEADAALGAPVAVTV